MHFNFIIKYMKEVIRIYLSLYLFKPKLEMGI